MKIIISLGVLFSFSVISAQYMPKFALKAIKALKLKYPKDKIDYHYSIWMVEYWIMA